MSDLFNDQPHTFTLGQMLTCADREVKQREHVYPRLIAAGKMTQAKADHELGCMRAIAARLALLIELGEQ